MRFRQACALVTVVVASTSGVLVAAPSQAVGDGVIVYDKGGHIWLMHDDGSSKTDLTPGWSGFAFDPSLSPDGTEVVFAWQSSGGAVASAEIYSIPAEPTAQANGTRLTDNNVRDIDPAWSPDGTKIAFTRDVPSDAEPQNYEIYTMSANGTSPLRLTQDSDGDTDGSPTWSPDGSHIAFRSTRVHEGCDDGGGFFLVFSHVYVMTATGGNLADLTDKAGLVTGDPAWSPDGTKIAFDADQWTLGPDQGSGPTCVTDTGDHIYVMPSTGSTNPGAVHTGNDPAWSPDSAKIAFIDGVGQAMATMDADGSNVASLSESGRFPDWGTAPVRKVATTITIGVRSGAKLKAHGTVQPNVSGQSVSVTLYRKSAGVFKKVRAVTVVLSATSSYAAAFVHPKAGSCKVTTRFAGDATHLPSAKSTTTPC